MKWNTFEELYKRIKPLDEYSTSTKTSLLKRFVAIHLQNLYGHCLANNSFVYYRSGSKTLDLFYEISSTNELVCANLELISTVGSDILKNIKKLKSYFLIR